MAQGRLARHQFSIFYEILREKIKDKYQNHYIDLEDFRYLSILDAGIDSFVKHLKEEGFDLTKKIFVFIDEIQYLSTPSSFLKIIADHHPKIKLVVSGSSSFNIKNKFKDSLVGRTINFEIFNLSFEEFLDFKGYFFNKKAVFTSKKIDELKELFREYVLFGGYPKIVLTDSKELKKKYIQQIIDTYVRKDIRDLVEIKDVSKFNNLLEVLASQSGKQLNVVELADTIGLNKNTIDRYLFLLEQTYIVRLVRPYYKNIRSEISKMPKIFFYDTGLAQMLWFKDITKEIMGEVFETSIFSELVKKYGMEKVFYWRTLDKKEIDFILKERRNILPIEAKYNFNQFNNTAVDYFIDKNKTKEYLVVGLDGKKTKKEFIYPWEI